MQTPIAPRASPTRKPLHIIRTSFLDGNEVLVGFSDGTAAIFEAEELEKLRPTLKRRLPDHRGTDHGAPAHGRAASLLRE